MRLLNGWYQPKDLISHFLSDLSIAPGLLIEFPPDIADMCITWPPLTLFSRGNNLACLKSSTLFLADHQSSGNSKIYQAFDLDQSPYQNIEIF